MKKLMMMTALSCAFAAQTMPAFADDQALQQRLQVTREQVRGMLKKPENCKVMCEEMMKNKNAKKMMCEMMMKDPEAMKMMKGK